jgi:micrococcal nuclease
VLGNLFGRIAAYPFWTQTLLYLAVMLAALIAFGLLVLLSPFVMILAGLVLIGAIFALVVRLLRRRPPRRWGLIAVMSLVVLLVFTGIANALYFSGQPEQANSPKPEKQTSKPNPNPESPEQAEEHKGAEQVDQKLQEPEQAGANTEAQPNAVEPPASVTVKRAVDGDTIEISPAVDGKGTVRLIGIDAPEEEKPGCGAQPLAQEAADTLANWEGSNVKLEFDEDRTDRYGRLLAYVHADALGDTMLNEDMLRSGYAQLWILAPNTKKYEDKLRGAQHEAKEDPLFDTSIWTLSPSKQDQLADHGNGIGEGDGACPLQQQNTASSSASSAASLDPSTNNNNVPDYNDGSRNAAGYSTSSSTSAPGGSSAPSSPAPSTGAATTEPPTSSPASPPTASPSASPTVSPSAPASP